MPDKINGLNEYKYIHRGTLIFDKLLSVAKYSEPILWNLTHELSLSWIIQSYYH